MVHTYLGVFFLDGGSSTLYILHSSSLSMGPAFQLPLLFVFFLKIDGPDFFLKTEQYISTVRFA